MTKRRVQLCSVLLLSSFILSALVCARLAGAQETVLQKNSTRTAALAELAGYRQWVRVNEKPLEVIDASTAGG